MQNAYLKPTPDQTFEVIGTGRFDFGDILSRSRFMEREGHIEEACNLRFQGVQSLQELLPDDEEVNLEWDHVNSRAAMELIYASAIDHFLINDFEMSAALLELLLDLDPEDHLEGSETLAWDYLCMDERELFDEVINDVSDKYPSRLVLLLWADFRQNGKLPEGELQRFKSRYATYYREFIAEEHSADDSFLADLESDRPSEQALARELWLQTENIWAKWPDFIEALKATAK